MKKGFVRHAGENLHGVNHHAPLHGENEEKEMPLGRTNDSLLGDIFRIILSIILPPLGVFLEVGFGKHFWINVILTLLGFIPGIIHAVYIIATR